MEGKQIVKDDELEAITEATLLAASASYVVVILSKGKYYIEQEPTMIRTWESVIAEFENGKRIMSAT